MPTVRRERLSDGEVIVVDDPLPAEAIAVFHRGLLDGKFRRGESARPDTGEIRNWALELEPARFAATDLGQETVRQVERLFAEGMTLHRAYCNVATFGDLLLAHRDCGPRDGHVTALWFVCERWDEAWGGELLFFDSPGEARFAVSPQPGRLCLFHGAILHRGRAPERQCHAARYMLVAKFAPKGPLGAG